MHIYFIPRGINQQVELFKIFMQSQMWPWVRTNMETKKKEVTMFQGAIRDLGFCWGYTFPKECLKEVCDMLGIKSGEGDDKISGLKKYAIRKVLGNKVKKLPKKIETPQDYPRVCLAVPPQNEGDKSLITPYRYVERRGIQIHVLGIKEDKVKELDYTNLGKGKYKQEML